MSCQAIDAVAQKSAFRLPELAETLEATVGLDHAMASNASAGAKRFG